MHSNSDNAPDVGFYRSHDERDDLVDPALRPLRFDDYTGQSAMKRRLSVAVRAAKMRGEALDHVLMSGPPGLGKTTMAAIIANELGVEFHSTSGPAIEKKGDLAAMLTDLEEGDVLFIDEIHRMNAAIEENLYPAMEDFQLDIFLGEGAHARSLKLNLPRFTLIGATTRTGLLTGPLRARFGILERLDYYAPADLAQIILRNASILGMVVDEGAAQEMACRSRGTPRTANRLLRRVRDYMEVAREDFVSVALAQHAMNELDIDENGFDTMDRRYLEALVVHFNGGPVGLETLAAALGESSDAIEDVYEPYLIQNGFLQRTPRGRLATQRAWNACGLEFIT